MTHNIIEFQGAVDARNPYKGPPSLDLERTWQELEDGKFSFLLRDSQLIVVVAPRFTISQDEMAQADIRSIELSGKPGRYLAQLDVVHQLHCLNFIRKRLRKGAYTDTSILSSVDDYDHTGKSCPCLSGSRY